eukprot:6178159-Pleurochrysis_carterae.AAC.1
MRRLQAGRAAGAAGRRRRYLAAPRYRVWRSGRGAGAGPARFRLRRRAAFAGRSSSQVRIGLGGGGRSCGCVASTGVRRDGAAAAVAWGGRSVHGGCSQRGVGGRSRGACGGGAVPALSGIVV